MGRNLVITVAASLALLLTNSVFAANSAEKRVNSAISVLNDFTKIPEQGIPSSILTDAYGVAVIPGMTKVGAVIGGRYGKGILVVRQEDGSWSNPSFVKMGGGSLGWQFGAQSTDLVLVFRNARSIESIADGKFTLGGDASVAAGPVGRSSSAATDQRLQAEIYSYSRNRGLFAGFAIDGSWMSMDAQANAEYYKSNLSATQILAADKMPAPLGAAQFTELLTATAPRVDGPAPLSRTAEATRPQAEPAEVRTFAIDPVAGGGDETVF
jgi:lipid-binding SYLF domain-containing protein